MVPSEATPPAPEELLVADCDLLTAVEKVVEEGGGAGPEARAFTDAPNVTPWSGKTKNPGNIRRWCCLSK